ncbi:MAG: hypothetical protein HN948_10005, partial [Clostridia bacterium]|nr:hypothetical protein [Clostridia bacterium]
SGGRVRGISISSQGISYVPVDNNFNPIRNAFSWLDGRAEEQIAQIQQQYSEQQMYDITGKSTKAFYTLPKIMWLMQNEPDVYDKAYKLLLPHDFVVAKLCGVPVTDHTLAGGTMMYDIVAQTWDNGIIDKFGVDKNKLPNLAYSATAVGTIMKSVATELGLPDNVVVTVGGQDQKCAAFGAGIDEGIATISLGTATAIGKRWSSPHKDSDMRIPSFSFLFENTWFTEGVLGTAAACMRWLKETFFEDYTFEQMSDMVENADDYKTELSFYPHFVGNGSPNLHYNSSGMYSGIHLNTTRQDFVRALFEGIAMQIEENLEVMEGTTELRVFGGGASSSAWCEIIADVTNTRVKILRSHEVACSGAAMLAGMGSGVYANEAVASGKVSIAKIYEPNSAKRDYYANKYEQYKALEQRAFGPN